MHDCCFLQADSDLQPKCCTLTSPTIATLVLEWLWSRLEFSRAELLPVGPEFSQLQGFKRMMLEQLGHSKMSKTCCICMSC